MATLGGGPPMLSLLTGVAKGVTDAQKREQEEKRQAILNRLRQSQIQAAEENLEIRRAQEERLREAEARRRAQAGREHVAGIVERGRERQAEERERQELEEIVDVRAQELVDQHGLQPGAARVRARGEVMGKLNELPRPKPQGEDQLSPSEIDRTRQNEFDQKVDEILNNSTLRAALTHSPDIESLGDLVNNESIRQQGYGFDELKAAWEEMGIPDQAEDFDRQSVESQAVLDAQSRIRSLGSKEAALHQFFRAQQQAESMGMEMSREERLYADALLDALKGEFEEDYDFTEARDSIFDQLEGREREEG